MGAEPEPPGPGARHSALVGALLLGYNFNPSSVFPASIFLGDSGSLFIGFLRGCHAVLWSQKSVTILSMAAPLMSLALPLSDTSLAIARRFLSGQPIFGADRGHIHHRLLARGLTPKAVTLILYAACGVGAIFAISASVLSDQFAGLLVALFSAGVWMGVRHLGYDEFRVTNKKLVAGSFRKRLKSQMELVRFSSLFISIRRVRSFATDIVSIRRLYSPLTSLASPNTLACWPFSQIVSWKWIFHEP